MIEVRTMYRVRMPDAEGPVEELADQARREVWPILGWRGRVQQMLHGRAQQSIFVWSFHWESLAAWEAAQAAAEESAEYRDWRARISPRLLHGAGREVFSVFEGSSDPDLEPGRIEVRSAYLAPADRWDRARELMRRALELPGWSGQNQEAVAGAGAPGTFVWSSTWDGLGAWEAAMSADDDVLEEWFADWVAAVDFGGTREIFRNL